MAVAEVYEWERLHDKALAQYQKVIALDPSFFGAHGNVAQVYARKHMYAEAMSELQQKWTLYGDPSFAQVLQRVYATSGYPATIREQLNRMLRDRAKGQYADPVGIAECYAELDDPPHAFEWLQKGYEEHSSSMQYVMLSAGFDAIRSSTQFQYWRGVVGLPASVNIESNR